jgi:RimJ/RimL family protein N-acetyltransferase
MRTFGEIQGGSDLGQETYGRMKARLLIGGSSAQNLFRRLGFRCEARPVEAGWFKGEWTTMRVYAMLEREWRAGGRSFAERPVGIR